MQTPVFPHSETAQNVFPADWWLVYFNEMLSNSGVAETDLPFGGDVCRRQSQKPSQSRSVTHPERAL